jgi:hypothetical protein
MESQHSPLGRVHQARDPLIRFCRKKATSENHDENLFCEDYARTISSENYNPFSKGSDRNLRLRDALGPKDGG